MQDINDIELLGRYAAQGCEEAFAALVARHVNLVYSVALRRVGNPHMAEEVTQSVFVLLARKAPLFGKRTILQGWLHKTAWFTADNVTRLALEDAVPRAPPSQIGPCRSGIKPVGSAVRVTTDGGAPLRREIGFGNQRH